MKTPVLLCLIAGTFAVATCVVWASDPCCFPADTSYTDTPCCSDDGPPICQQDNLCRDVCCRNIGEQDCEYIEAATCHVRDLCRDDMVPVYPNQSACEQYGPGDPQYDNKWCEYWFCMKTSGSGQPSLECDPYGDDPQPPCPGDSATNLYPGNGYDTKGCDDCNPMTCGSR